MPREYHVAKSGNDKNAGTAENPFLTISRAAKIADEGDTVIVHEGTYRENISPEQGARNELGRITWTPFGRSTVCAISPIICWRDSRLTWHTITMGMACRLMSAIKIA